MSSDAAGSTFKRSFTVCAYSKRVRRRSAVWATCAVVQSTGALGTLVPPAPAVPELPLAPELPLEPEVPLLPLLPELPLAPELPPLPLAVEPDEPLEPALPLLLPVPPVLAPAPSCPTSEEQADSSERTSVLLSRAQLRRMA
jgi:hypothetical protein